MKLSKEAQARREAQVLAYLEENPGWASAVAVSEEIGESRISVARALARLAHKGVLNQKADVRYDSAKRQKIRNVYFRASLANNPLVPVARPVVGGLLLVHALLAFLECSPCQRNRIGRVVLGCFHDLLGPLHTGHFCCNFLCRLFHFPAPALGLFPRDRRGRQRRKILLRLGPHFAKCNHFRDGRGKLDMHLGHLVQRPQDRIP